MWAGCPHPAFPIPPAFPSRPSRPMKLPVLILAGSLAANAALVAVYLNHSSVSSELAASTPSSTHAHPGANATAGAPSTVTPGATASASTTGPTVDPKTWASLNPGDLRGLVARLRAAGFPPSTIRAIVSAQVTDQLRSKFLDMTANLETKPFWTTDRSSFGNNDPKTLAAFREMSRESARLLKEALGPDFPTTDDDASEYQRRRFGNLPKDKIDQLQRITDDYDDLRNQTNAAARGLMLPEDREKLALLEKEKRADLAKVLSPDELEDYLMRTSNTTAQLRSALTAFNASDAEFRSIYQVRAAFDEKYGFQNMSGSISADFMKDRNAAQLQASEQLKAVLGADRYAEYARVSDREYQAITRIAQQANLPPAAAVQTYNLRDNASKESNRIFADTALTTEQKLAAFQTLAQTTRTQITATLGADAGATYLKVAGWLTNIERGAAVTFTDMGTTSRNLPNVRRVAPNPSAPTGTTTTVVAPKTGG